MKKRARDYGFTFEGKCGEFNAITDVSGVEVGYTTLIRGVPAVNTEIDPDFARTGVTAILPRGKRRSAVFAGRFDFNGNGELTGTHWIDDSGFLHGPILLTNTHSVGTVRDAATKWIVKNKFYYPSHDTGDFVEGPGFFYPVVGETFDGSLNYIDGFAVKTEDAWAALDNAKSGYIEEGNVGGGTGMRCHGFKGGTGTASRVLPPEAGGYTVGALVQANHGTRDSFQFRGVHIGRELEGYEEIIHDACIHPGDGSIIVVLATDAPVMPWQLKKMCRRVSLGLADLGGGCENGSGDIFIAFSTGNDNSFTFTKTTVEILGDESMDPIYRAVEQVVEEAIMNALVAAEDMTGYNLNFSPGMPSEEIVEILKKHGRL